MAGAGDIEKKDMDPTVLDSSSSSISEREGIRRSEDRDEIDTSGPIPIPEPVKHRQSDGTAAEDTEKRPGTLTRASSIAPSIHVVPRGERRGLLARLAVIPEITVPIAYKNSTKWLITAIVAISGACAPMGSAIVLPALNDVAKEFGSSHAITNFSVAFYMLSLGVFPLWWSSFSETLGRRTIYLVSFSLFVVFGVLCAVSKSISMFIVMRILSGGAAASVQAVGAGTIADIWEPKERGRAMGYFYLGPLCGPFLAPIFGGALAQSLGWRSTQWFLVIYGAVLVLLILFALPETLKRRRNVVAEATAETDRIEKANGGNGASHRPNLHRTSTRQSVAVKTKKWVAILRRCFLDPLKILLLLRFPAILITAYYASITFGVLYFLNVSIQETFADPPYRFSTIIIGLLYIPNSLGYILASLFGGRWIDYIMKREAKKAGRVDAHGKLIFRPEDRMKENAWLSCFLFPLALLWYGWSVQYGVHWIVPMIANFFFGVGSMLVFAMATTMLTEFLPKRASNGIAVNNFLRNICSCAGGLIAEPAIRGIGNGWLSTILCIWALGSGALTIWAMKRFGDRWRVKMDKKLQS